MSLVVVKMTDRDCPFYNLSKGVEGYDSTKFGAIVEP